MNTAAFDTCMCGDYRHQHAERREHGRPVWDACNVCVEGDPMNGRRCLQFRVPHTAHVTWKAAA